MIKFLSVFLTVATIGLYPQVLKAQQTLDAAPFAPLILAQAQELGQICVDLEYKKVVEALHPDFFEYMMSIQEVEKEFESFKRSSREQKMSLNFVFHSPGKISKTANDYYCLVPFRFEMIYRKIAEPNIEYIEWFMVAHSVDFGKTWKFILVYPESIRIKEFIEKMAEVGIVIPPGE